MKNLLFILCWRNKAFHKILFLRLKFVKMIFTRDQSPEFWMIWSLTLIVLEVYIHTVSHIPPNYVHNIDINMEDTLPPLPLTMAGVAESVAAAMLLLGLSGSHSYSQGSDPPHALKKYSLSPCRNTYSLLVIIHGDLPPACCNLNPAYFSTSPENWSLPPACRSLPSACSSLL